MTLITESIRPMMAVTICPMTGTLPSAMKMTATTRLATNPEKARLNGSEPTARCCVATCDMKNPMAMEAEMSKANRNP